MTIIPNCTENQAVSGIGNASVCMHTAQVYDTVTAPTVASLNQYETYKVAGIGANCPLKMTFRPKIKGSASGGIGVFYPNIGDPWVATSDDIPHYGIGVYIEAVGGYDVQVIFKLFLEMRSGR